LPVQAVQFVTIKNCIGLTEYRVYCLIVFVWGGFACNVWKLIILPENLIV